MNQLSLPQAVPSRSAGLSVCPECQTPFQPYKRAEGYQRFCGPACRTRAWKREKHPEKAPPKPKTGTRADRILDRLGQGPATGLDLLKAGGGTRYSARISELRAQGHCILGPQPWKRPDGSMETRTTEATAEGFDVYELEDA